MDWAAIWTHGAERGLLLCRSTIRSRSSCRAWGPTRAYAAVGPGAVHSSCFTAGLLAPTPSMLPASTIRSLGQKEYEKRKHAALEVEALVRELREARRQPAPDPLLGGCVAPGVAPPAGLDPAMTSQPAPGPAPSPFLLLSPPRPHRGVGQVSLPRRARPASQTPPTLFRRLDPLYPIPQAGQYEKINSVVKQLATELAQSAQANVRKGALQALSGTAIGLRGGDVGPMLPQVAKNTMGPNIDHGQV